jgi:hypothetical protein
MISAVNCRPLNGFFLPVFTTSPSQRTQRHSPNRSGFKAATEPDQAGIYGIIGKHHPEADVIIRPRSTAVLSDGVQTTPTQRDRHLQSIAEHGRMGWQKASGYNQRALVESAIGRLKRVIGDALRSRTDRRRTTEIAIAVHALNRMLELGRPKSVRTA